MSDPAVSKNKASRTESFEVRFGKYGASIIACPRLAENNNAFSSGSEGFYAGGKIVIDGEQYQVTCSIVRIGSKPSK